MAVLFKVRHRSGPFSRWVKLLGTVWMIGVLLWFFFDPKIQAWWAQIILGLLD